MSAARKVTAYLRTEPTERLPQLLRLYPHDTKAIQAEITRRQHLAGTTPTPYQRPKKEGQAA